MADYAHNRTAKIQAATVTRRGVMQAGAAAALASGGPLLWPAAARADKAKIDAVLTKGGVVRRRARRRGGRRR